MGMMPRAAKNKHRIMIKDVSVRAGLAYSLEMTKAPRNGIKSSTNNRGACRANISTHARTISGHQASGEYLWRLGSRRDTRRPGLRHRPQRGELSTHAARYRRHRGRLHSRRRDASAFDRLDEWICYRNCPDQSHRGSKA